MRVLAVLPNVCYPATNGGALRALHLLQHLKRAHELSLFVINADRKSASAVESALGLPVYTAGRPRLGDVGRMALRFAHGTPATYVRYARRSVGKALEELLRRVRFDAFHFDHLHAAQWLPLARAVQPSAQMIIDEHNVESEVVAGVARLPGAPARPVLRWQSRLVRRLEQRLVGCADLVLACSEEDATRLRALGARGVRVVPNGVAHRPSSHPTRPRGRNVVFIGSFDWLPNADAAIRLAKEVWPAVEDALAPSKLVLVGRSPSAAVRSLAGRNVVVTGSVSSVNPFLEDAWATAIPLRAGSGTRLKILEAAAAGVPVVASGLAAEGLGMGEGEDYLRAESNADFANALRALRDDPLLADRLRRNAMEVAARYAWNRVGDTLLTAYDALDSSAGR